jgi:hypothetical protein
MQQDVCLALASMQRLACHTLLRFTAQGLRQLVLQEQGS